MVVLKIGHKITKFQRHKALHPFFFFKKHHLFPSFNEY